jgi:hypothetical protein
MTRGKSAKKNPLGGVEPRKTRVYTKCTVYFIFKFLPPGRSNLPLRRQFCVRVEEGLQSEVNSRNP